MLPRNGLRRNHAACRTVKELAEDFAQNPKRRMKDQGEM